MKLFLKFVFVLVMASCVWAQDSTAVDSVSASPVKPVREKKIRPACEHRGFFFSAGVGVSYFDASSVKESRYVQSTGWSSEFESRNVNEEMTKDAFSGFALPLLEFRFGKSIGNLVALYAMISSGFYRGQGEYSNFEREQYYEGPRNGKDSLYFEHIDDDIEVKDVAFGVSFSVGLGVSVYPFRNPDFVLNGLYVGISSGFDGFAGELDNGYSDFDYAAIFTRYEIGKDWWLSESWSVGVAFAYINDVYSSSWKSDTESKSGVFQFLIRLTHG